MHKIVGAARETGYLRDFPAISTRPKPPTCRARQCALSLHRQPGRAARRAGAHRRGRSSQCASRRGRCGDLFLAHHPRQRNRRSRAAEPAGGAGRGSADRRDHFVHVSGHPARDELAQMYRWIAPAHRRARAWRAAPHDRACAAGEIAAGARRPWCSPNGQMLRLAPGRAESIDEMPSGRIYLDGKVLVAEGEGHARSAARCAFAGLIAITLVLDGKGRVAGEPRDHRGRSRSSVHAAVRAAVEEAARRYNRSGAARKRCRKPSVAPPAAPRRTPGARNPSLAYRRV